MIGYGNSMFIGRKSSGAAIDPNAQSFITAAGISNALEIQAINELVLDLKTFSLWSKMLVVYPFVGGTAQSNSKNLKDTSFATLSYSTGITHGSLGIKGNGSSYANTGLLSTQVGISQNSAASGVYMQSWAVNQTMAYGHFGNLTMYKGLPAIYPMLNSGLAPSYNPATFDGFMQMSRNNATNLIFKHKNNLATTFVSPSQALNNSLRLYVCYANNYNGVSDWISFNYYSLGLTETDLVNMNTAVQKFQTTLGRQK